VEKFITISRLTGNAEAEPMFVNIKNIVYVRDLYGESCVVCVDKCGDVVVQEPYNMVCDMITEATKV
jgi:hypothetical protein